MSEGDASGVREKYPAVNSSTVKWAKALATKSLGDDAENVGLAIPREQPSDVFGKRMLLSSVL